MLAVLAIRLLGGRSRQLALVGWAGAMIAAVAVAVSTPRHIVEPSQGAGRRNVLLISIDSLRGDVFHEYLLKHASSELRDFVGDARLYRNAHTNFAHSPPSHASMLTGSILRGTVRCPCKRWPARRN